MNELGLEAEPSERLMSLLVEAPRGELDLGHATGAGMVEGHPSIELAARLVGTRQEREGGSDLDAYVVRSRWVCRRAPGGVDGTLILDHFRTRRMGRRAPRIRTRMHHAPPPPTWNGGVRLPPWQSAGKLREPMFRAHRA